MLTATQTLAATDLRASRPTVYYNTRVIVSETAREYYYRRVTDMMDHLNVAAEDVGAFCDLAGIPD